MANLNDVLQGLVNLNSKMANNINNLLDSIGEGFLDVGELTVSNGAINIKDATILVNGSNITIDFLTAGFSGNKICFLEYRQDKTVRFKVVEVVDANFNYDLSQFNATSKHFEVARQYNGVFEDRRVASMASKDNTIVGALNGALKAIDYDNEMDLEINMDILSRVSAVESDILDLDTKKADKTYVDEAVANVDIDGVVTAVGVGEVEDIENPYITREDLDEILGDTSDNSSGITVPRTYATNANDTDNILGYYPTNDFTLNLPSECYNAGDDKFSLWGILFTQTEPNYGTIVQQYIPTWGAWANVTFTRAWNDDVGFTPWAYHLDSSEWDYELQTNNKTIIGAINELFQSANNGKELIASSIGEPLSSNQTFQAMSNDIDSLLSTFKANMMNNGVTINSGDKFKQLIDKLANLNDAGGSSMQVISGEYDFNQMVSKTFTLTDDYTFSSSTNPSLGYIELEFDTPPILVYVENYIHLNLAFLVNYKYVSNSIYDTVLNNEVVLSTYDYGNTVPEGQIYHVHPIIEGNKYTIPVAMDIYEDAYVDQDYTPTLKEKHCRWFAICGDATEDTTLRDSLASILQDEGVNVTEEDDMASLISKVDQKFDESGDGIDIISATALPATGKENQVCVITDNPVNNFIISPTLSNYNYSSDTICALTSMGGDISPVVLTSNNITQYYYFDKMYQGNTFKKSYLYKNGAWQEYTPSEAILIKGGTVVNDAIFGGLAYYGGDGSTEIVSENLSYVRMYFKTTQSNYYWAMCSNKVIDFSKFSTIKINFTCPNGSGFYVGLGNHYGLTDPADYYGFSNSYGTRPSTNEWVSYGVTQPATINISSWNKQGFLVIYFDNQTGTSEVRFTDITMY